MTIYHVPFAHLPDGLARDVRLVEEDGRWVEVTANASPRWAVGWIDGWGAEWRFL